MPQFLDSPTVVPLAKAEPEESTSAYLREYRALGDDIHSAMTFTDFCHFKGKNKPKAYNRPTTLAYAISHTRDLQRLEVFQHLPRYQEYLALGDGVCEALSFQDYYTIKFGSQPKDLDEDLLKGIIGGGRKMSMKYMLLVSFIWS